MDITRKIHTEDSILKRNAGNDEMAVTQYDKRQVNYVSFLLEYIARYTATTTTVLLLLLLYSNLMT